MPAGAALSVERGTGAGVTPPPVVAVGAIVLAADDRILLVRRGRPPGVGLWTVPGGKLEPGERLADAVVREVLEETAVAVTCGPLVEVIERVIPGDPGWHYVILDYLATPLGDVVVRAGDDVTDARWVSEAELAELPLTDGLLPVLARARQMRPNRRLIPQPPRRTR